MSHAYTYAVSKDTGSIALQMTLYVIAMHVNVETGCTYAGVKTLMREARVKSDRTMRNYVAKLEKKGLIRREKRVRQDGSRSTDNIELVGFREWYVAHMGQRVTYTANGRVVEAAARFTGGGPVNSTGGSGSLATAHYHPSNDKDNRSSRCSDKRKTPAVVHRFVSEAALDSARKLAPGWDRQELLRRFLEWPESKKARNMDAAFLGWVRTYTKGKPPRGASVLVQGAFRVMPKNPNDELEDIAAKE